MHRTIVVPASGIYVGAMPDEQTRTSGMTAVHGQVQGGFAKLVGRIHVRLFGNKLFQAFLMPLDRRDMDRALRPGFRVHGEITAPASEEQAREEEARMGFKEDHNHVRWSSLHSEVYAGIIVERQHRITEDLRKLQARSEGDEARGLASF
jgi:hypothetical protein